MRSTAAAAAMLAVACGVAAADPPADLGEALRRLDATLAGVRHVSPYDLLGDMRSTRYVSARAVIRGKQCASGTPNPLVVMSRQSRVSVKGRFEPQGVQITGHTFDIPLYVVPVGDLPAEYLKQVGTLADGLSPDEARRLRAQLPGQYDMLESRVSGLIASFDPGACGQDALVRGVYGRASDTVVMPPSY
ncbi:MAG: hypothetical protein H7Y14_02520 [Burkholderiales bacterium]|nr:hypothetical protein [Burkholderiales bacterium]